LINARTEENVTSAIMEDPMKKALIQIQGVFSELEKSLLVKKLKVARDRKKAKTGKCEGRKGYRDSDEGKEFFKKAKLKIAALRRNKGRSFNEIAEVLNSQGFLSWSGKPWSGQMVHKLLTTKL
jgi:site-specific DNA recombinase